MVLVKQWIYDWASRENKTITHIKGIGMVIYSESNRINDEAKIYTGSKIDQGQKYSAKT